jgi:anti-anti-sigma factor
MPGHGFVGNLTRKGRIPQMPTRITQIDDEGTGRTILQVEGSVELADAELLRRLSTELLEKGIRSVTLDLTDITFLDSDGGSVLAQMKKQGVVLEGIHSVVQKEIENAEKQMLDARC